VVVDVEATDGRRVRGYAGDNLAPKWFDKDPSKSFRDNVKDELAAIRIAHQAYLEAAKVPRSVFQIWLDAFAECRRLGPGLHLNPLTVSFGPSFFERALADAAARLCDRVVECPVRIATGPLPNSKCIEVYARLGYGLLTYKTVRTVERAAFPAPNLVFCGLGDPAVVEPTPRRLDPAAVTWAASFGLPSAKPEVWRADVAKARARLPKSQLLVVSVIGTPAPGGDGEQLAHDYAQAARWAAEAGADVVEAHLSCPTISAERPQMVFEDQALAAHVVEMVRGAVGARPVVAKLGAMRSPRPLHDLATALARWVDGFALRNHLLARGPQVHRLQRDWNAAPEARAGQVQVFDHPCRCAS
jgi:dihydroorotate dehydrogenase